MLKKNKKVRKKKDIIVSLSYSLLGGHVPSWLTWTLNHLKSNDFAKKKKKNKRKKKVTLKTNTTIDLKFYFQNIFSCEDTKLTLKN